MNDFLRHRLSSHRLDRTAFARPEEAVAWYGAMQGQDYRHAKWAVGIRCAGVSEADVEQAIADRTLIRTWAMRGTLHLVASDDAIWLLAGVVVGAAVGYLAGKQLDRSFSKK